jgi:hypothetical protein
VSLQDIGGARGVGTVAHLLLVTDSGIGAANVALGAGLEGAGPVVAAVRLLAALGVEERSAVGVSGARIAGGGLAGIVGAGRGRTAAELGNVAGVGGGTAQAASGLEHIGGAGAVDAIAVLHEVASADRIAAREDVFDGVGWAEGVHTGAVLGKVAGSVRSAAHSGAGQERVGPALLAGTVTVLGDVAQPGSGTASRAAVGN